MTSIKITNQYHSVEIVDNGDDLTIYDMIENLIKPALLALSYHPDLIAEAFGGEEEETSADQDRLLEDM